MNGSLIDLPPAAGAEKGLRGLHGKPRSLTLHACTVPYSGLNHCNPPACVIKGTSLTAALFDFQYAGAALQQSSVVDIVPGQEQLCSGLPYPMLFESMRCLHSTLGMHRSRTEFLLVGSR